MNSTFDIDAFRAGFPAELCEGAVWLVSRSDDKAPCRIENGRLVKANGADGLPDKHTIDEVLDFVAQHEGTFPTRCMQADDDFWCIDLDLKEEAPRADKLQVFADLINGLGTYAEVSSGGKGFHIWGHGKVPTGLSNRDSQFDIEFYRDRRHIISTGRAIRKVEVSGSQLAVIELGLLPITDGGQCFKDKVLPRFGGRRFDAPSMTPEFSKAPKFRELNSEERGIHEKAMQDEDYQGAFNGDMAVMQQHGIGFKAGEFDHSQAEFWLARRLARVCRDPNQVYHLFMQAPLLRLKKVNPETGEVVDRFQTKILARKDYVFARTIMSAWQETAQVAFEKDALKEATDAPLRAIMAEYEGVQSLREGSATDFPTDREGQLTPSGQLMRAIHKGLNRKMDVVSLTAGLAILSTLAGRAYNVLDRRTASIHPTGLNLYLVLSAPQGTGKEGMAEAIASVARQVDDYAAETLGWTEYDEPMAPNWVSDDESMDIQDFTTAAGLLARRDVASGQALRNGLNRYRNMFHLCGEFGKILGAINDPSAGGGFATIKREMLDQFMRSGRDATSKDVLYADKARLIKGGFPVSYTLVGETTSASLEAGLTRDCLEDGFLSRFITLSHVGERPKFDWNMGLSDGDLPDLVKHNLALVRRQATVNLFTDKVVCFEFDEYAATRFQCFCDEATIQADKAEQQDKPHHALPHLRSGLHVKRIAGLLAVCDNPERPVVRLHHVNWAIMLVGKSGEFMVPLAASSGSDIEARTEEVKRAIAKWQAGKFADAKKGRLRVYRQHGIITRRFLQRRLVGYRCFRLHRLGATKALDETLEALCKTGFFEKVSREAAVALLQSTGDAAKGGLGDLYRVHG